MLKKLIIATFFIFITAPLFLAESVIIVNTQSDPINQKNAEGKKHGKWIYYGRDRPEDGYPVNGKIEEGNYKNGRREGTWIKYHKDGITPRLIGEYVNNRPSGKYTKYHSTGKIAEKGSFIDGQYGDTVKRYYESGKIQYEAVYNNGKEQGNVRYFYNNGKIELEYFAQEGIAFGKATRYYENGDIKEVLEFDKNGAVKNRETKSIENTKIPVSNNVKSGEMAPKIANPIVKGGRFQPNGYNKVYNTDDEIWQDGDFKGGRLFNGKVYVYDRDGILLKVRIFKNGIYHSDGQL